jgi:hypothetical protein
VIRPKRGAIVCSCNHNLPGGISFTAAGPGSGRGGDYCEDCDIVVAVPADSKFLYGVRPGRSMGRRGGALGTERAADRTEMADLISIGCLTACAVNGSPGNRGEVEAALFPVALL